MFGFATARYIAFIAALVYGFLVPKVIIEIVPDGLQVSYFLAMGLVYYLTFFELGFGKLSFSRVFSKESKLQNILVRCWLVIFFYLSILCFLVVLTFNYAFLKEIPGLIKISIAFFVSTLFFLNFSKNLVNAIGWYKSFSYWDLFRVCALLSALILSWSLGNYDFFINSAAFLNTLFCIYIVSKLIRHNQIKFFQNIRRPLTAFRYFVAAFRCNYHVTIFSMTETLGYYAPFMYMYINHPAFLAFYSIYLRFLNAGFSVVRVIPDFFVYRNILEETSHLRTTRLFYCLSPFAFTIIPALLISSAVYCFLPYVSSIFFGEMYLIQGKLLLSICIMICANSWQHFSSNYMLSIGGYYKELFVYSSIFLSCISLIYVFGYCQGFSPENLILTSSIAYLIVSFAYPYLYVRSFFDANETIPRKVNSK